MRTRTSPENTILAAAFRWHNVKVEVKDAAGTWVDRSSYVIGPTWGADVDAPIAEAHVKFRRDSGANSLSPFRSDSPLNSGGPAIDAGRDIRISPATSAHGTAPVGGDYKLLFLGTIDSVDFGNVSMEVVARDQGGALVDAWIEAVTEYGTDVGAPVQDVIQAILDDWAPGVTLYVPVDPGFDILTYQQSKASVFETIRGLAGLPGWDIRYLWDNGTSAFRLTLFEPDRAKTVPDWTFAGDRYFDVTQLAISRELIRNYIVVTYTDADTGVRESVVAFDSASITRFGRRWMEIEEASDSPIDTEVEAQAEADAALSDLAWPIAEQQIELPFFWPLDIGDLLRFTANTVHSNSDLDLAVTGYQHELTLKKERTVISVRGKPAGFYRHWLQSGILPVAPVAPVTPAVPTRAQGVVIELGLQSAGGLLTISVTSLDPLAAGWRVYAKLGAQPTEDGTANDDSTPDMHYLVGDFLRSTRTRDIAAEDGTWYVVGEAYDAAGNPGPLFYVSLALSGGAGGPAGQLTNVTVVLVAGDKDRISWDHNAGAAGYTVRIIRSIDEGPNVQLVTGRNVALDGVADTVPLHGYYDTAPLDVCNPATDGPTCIYHQYKYIIELFDISVALVATYEAVKYAYTVEGS